jgi:hypothetical protein
MDHYNGENTNREAHHVADLLDRGNAGEAENRLRNDLYSLQNDPRGQHEFLNRVSQMDRKGYGADLQIQRGPDGSEYWNIVPAQYNQQNNYPGDYQRPRPYTPPPNFPPPYYPEPRPSYPPPPENRRPDPGTAILEGLAIGVGAAVINRAINGGHNNYYDRRWHRH